MSKIYLAESRGAKLFVEFGTSISFGWEEKTDAGVTANRYMMTFTREQFVEVISLWELWKHDPMKLPDYAGYLKTDATRAALPATVRQSLEKHEQNISESGQ